MEFERELCIKDLIKNVLLKWRWMLIWMLICALMLNGFNYYKTCKNAEHAKIQAEEIFLDREENSEEKEIVLADLEIVLSERERAEVKAAAMNYKNFYDSYYNASLYNDNSIRMKLNPDAVPSSTLTYYIDNHYEAVYPVIEKKDTTTDIIRTYSDCFNDKEIYNQICQELNLELDGKYLQEVVSFEVGGESLLCINILGETQEFCETIAENIKRKVEELTPEVRKIYGDFDIRLSSETFSECIVASLFTEQQNRLTGINNLRIYLANIGNNLNDEQEAYYYALLDGIELQYEETEEEEEIVIQIPPVEMINLSYIILGAIIGLMLVAGYEFLNYILGTKLHVAEEISKSYDISVLGILEANDKKKRTFGFVDDIIVSILDDKKVSVSEEIQTELICTAIKAAAIKANMKKVFVCSNCSNEKIELIKKSLKKEIDFITTGNSILSDVDSFKEFAYSDGVVLIEKIGESKFSEIEKEIELSIKNQVNVIGAIVL